MCSNHFPQTQMSFPADLPKRVYQVPLRMYSKSFHRKPAKHEKTSRDKFSEWSLIAFSEKNHWKQRRDVLASEKALQLIKVNTPAVINHLSWSGAVCFRPCFCVQQQEYEYADSNKAGTSKVSSWPIFHVPNRLIKKGNKHKLVYQSRLFGWQNFVFSSCQALNFAEFINGWCINWNFTVKLSSTT